MLVDAVDAHTDDSEDLTSTDSITHYLQLIRTKVRIVAKAVKIEVGTLKDLLKPEVASAAAATTSSTITTATATSGSNKTELLTRLAESGQDDW